MKKEKIYNLCYSKKNKNYSLDTEEAYVDKEKMIGYSKRELAWVATCLSSGMSIVDGKTRKECVEKINNIFYKIEEKRKSEEIKKYIDIYNKLKESEIDNYV